jgi:hypothetical protein
MKIFTIEIGNAHPAAQAKEIRAGFHSSRKRPVRNSRIAISVNRIVIVTTASHRKIRIPVWLEPEMGHDGTNGLSSSAKKPRSQAPTPSELNLNIIHFIVRTPLLRSLLLIFLRRVFRRILLLVRSVIRILKLLRFVWGVLLIAGHRIRAIHRICRVSSIIFV